MEEVYRRRTSITSHTVDQKFWGRTRSNWILGCYPRVAASLIFFALCVVKAYEPYLGSLLSACLSRIITAAVLHAYRISDGGVRDDALMPTGRNADHRKRQCVAALPTRDMANHHLAAWHGCQSSRLTFRPFGIPTPVKHRRYELLRYRCILNLAHPEVQMTLLLFVGNVRQLHTSHCWHSWQETTIRRILSAHRRSQVVQCSSREFVPVSFHEFALVFLK